MNTRKAVSAKGFSLIELLVVVIIIMIAIAVSIPYALNYSKLYATEDQAIKVMDLMREASQLALTRRRTIRFEINLNDNTAKIVDETLAVVKSIPLAPPREVRIDGTPTGISLPNPPSYGLANFGTTRIWTAHFTSSGSVMNAAGTTPVSATLYFWPPKKEPYDPADMVPRRKDEVRAVTIFGGSGAVRYWKHNGTSFVPYQ